VTGSATTFVHGAAGLRLAVDRWPASGAPAVLLLHGGGQTRHAWGPTADIVAACGYDVHAMDLRGHGDSGWCQHGRYRFDDFRADLEAMLEGVAGPAVVVGASLGGIVGLLAAGEAPSPKIAGLVLVDIAPDSSSAGAEKIMAFMRAAPDGFASLGEAAEAVAAYLPHRPRPRDPSGLMKNLRSRGGRLHWHWDPSFMEVTMRDRDSERLSRAALAVTVPTLLLHGAESEIVRPEDAVALKRLIPQAEVRVIPGARHMVAGDQNTAFGSAVLDFVRRILPVGAKAG
jgi:pimeloyl-ACP methyl ester carboxylesterase